MIKNYMWLLGGAAMVLVFVGAWLLSDFEDNAYQQQSSQLQADSQRLRASAILRELSLPASFPRESLAQLEAEIGDVVTPRHLASLPGMDAALRERGQRIRDQILATLRDPGSAIWGDIWTVDFVVFCGTVNARNAFGGFTGHTAFYVDRLGPVMESRHPDSRWSETVWAERCQGDRHVALAAASES